MKTIAFCLLALPVLAGLNVHPVERVRMNDTPEAVYYRDKMSDGTFRDSSVAKPRPPAYPERITIVTTNDLPSCWELVYEAAYAGGDVRTNRDVVVKTEPTDRIRRKPDMPPLPEPKKPRPTDALALTLARARETKAAEAPTEFRRMEPAESIRIDGGEWVKTRGGKEIERGPVRKAVSCRPKCAPIDKPEAPKESNTGETAAAVAAGVVMGLAAGLATKKKGA